jgi:putative ABC transport system permease protein
VSVETTLALVLMAGAALLLQSYRQSVRIDPGFRTADMLHARVTPPAGRYPDDRARTAFYQELHEVVAALPGVLDVTLTNVPPGVGAGAEQPFTIAGSEAPAVWPRTAWRSVSDTYFRTLEIPLVTGESFETRRDEARVAVVNQQFARQFFPGRDPVGERLQLVSSPGAHAPDAESWTIVGVAADAREAYAYEPAPPVVYVRFADRPAASMAILVRSAGTPLALAGALRGAVASIDADQPVYGLRDVEFIMASELDLNRLSLALLALFAGVALALAIAGIYGVVAHTVGQRLREMAVRLALGALPADVLRLIVGDCVRYAAVGAAAGLVLIVVLSSRLASLTRSWAGTDIRVLTMAALAVMAVAVVAAYLPARRAASLDPVTTLRQE